MNRRGKIDVQGVLNSDKSGSPRLSVSNNSNSHDFNNTGFENINNQNSIINNLNASPVSIINFLYKITGIGIESGKYDNVTDAFYINKLKSLPISRSQSGYEFTIQQAIVRGGRKKALVQILPNSKIQNLRDAHKEKPNQIELSVLVKKGNDEKKCRIVVYYNGIVTIQMGVFGDLIIDKNARTLLSQQVDAINQGIIQPLFPFIKGTGKFTNISGQFNFSKSFNVERLRTIISSLKNITDVKLPEMEVALSRFIFKYNGVTCMIFPNTGLCQMLGATSLDQLKGAKEYMLSSLSGHGMMLLKNRPPRRIKKKKTNVRKATLCPKSRHPDEKTGKCPLKTQFKRPNEQGDMCCYKIPKKISKKMQNKVVKAYRNANKNIPKNVRDVLDIKKNVNYEIKNELNDIFSLTPTGSIKIKKRMCTSYTKPQLVEFSTKLGLIIKPKRLKSNICADIYQEWRRRYESGGGLNKINILAGKNKGYLGLKINDKKCGSWTKKKLIQWAAERKIIINPKLKKIDICHILFNRANQNSRFESSIINKPPNITIVNGQVLIHDRSLNAYSNGYLKSVAKKLKLNAVNRYDIIREMNVKYTEKPTISVRNGKLHLMNRNATVYTKTELNELVKKIPNVNIKNSDTKNDIINTLFLTTGTGKQKQVNDKIKNLSSNKQTIVKNGLAKTKLSPEEILFIFKKFKIAKIKANNAVTTTHKRQLNKLQSELDNVDKNLNWWKRYNISENNNNNFNMNVILEMKNKNNLVGDKKSLKGKIKRLKKKDVEHSKQRNTIDILYKLLSKKPGFTRKYTTLAKMNNQNFGAVSLAKQDIHHVYEKLLFTPKNTNTVKTSPKKQNKLPRKYKSNKTFKSNINKLQIEWFVNGNRKAMRVVANNDNDISKFTTRARVNNSLNTVRNRKWKQATIVFKEPLSTQVNNAKAIKVAENKVRKIMKTKVPSNILWNI